MLMIIIKNEPKIKSENYSLLVFVHSTKLVGKESHCGLVFLIIFLLFNGKAYFSSQFTIKIKFTKLCPNIICFYRVESGYLSAWYNKSPHLKYYTSVIPDLKLMHSYMTSRGDDRG